MGQTLCKPRIREEALPFVNLPRTAVLDFRRTIYEVAEGYGLTLEELKQVISLCLRDVLGISETNIDECSESLFRLFDSLMGNKQLVDSFEVIATICLLSSMELEEKIHFVFDLFDFNETGDLNLNETTFAFRTLMSGATKITSSLSTVDANVIDQIAVEAYETQSTNHKVTVATDDCKLNKEDFFEFLFNCPEIKSLLDCFDDLDKNVVLTSNCDRSKYHMPLRFSTESDADCSNARPTLEGPWRDQIQFLKAHHDEETSASPPTTALSLEWIYGRNTRGPAALYGVDGAIFYPAGSLVVKLSADRSEQHYFTQHSGHVTCIDICHCDSFGEVIASADIGADSKICVWSTSDLTLLIHIPGFHQNGIAKLIFSPSGTLLFTLGNNSTNNVAIYEWKKRKLIFTAKGPGGVVYGCSFLGSDSKFGVCGSQSVYFWNRVENQPFSRSRGVFNKSSSREIMTSIACVEDAVISGSLSGRLWMWEGRVCITLLHDLHSSITCLRVSKSSAAELLVSTCDGNVYIFNSKFEVQSKLSNDCSSDPERFIDSICCSSERDRILIGQSSNLYEMNVSHKTSSCVVEGHSTATSFALLDNATIISVGDNGIVKAWDTITHTVSERISFDSNLSCITYSDILDQIAIGLAAHDVKSMASRSFMISRGKDIKNVIHFGCNAQKKLTACKYSNDGRFLAFGSEDCGIYIHLCKNSFPLIAKCRGHSGPISSIDFGTSESSTFLRSNSYAVGEAMFWRASDGKLQTPMSQRRTQWESQSCALCSSLEGVHKLVSVSSLCLNNGRKGGLSSTLFVGESSGKVRVFRHPVNDSAPPAIAYKGHSGSITNVLCRDDDIVYSMSSLDTCIFQWKCTKLNWHDEPGYTMKTLPEATQYDMECMIQQLNELDFTKTPSPVETTPKQRSLPWKRSIAPPTSSQLASNDLPDGTLALERVHGYDGKGKDNLHCVQDCNVIIYSVAKIVVLLNVETHTQRFYVTDGQITCISLKSNICAVACTGSDGGSIHILDLDTLKLLSRMSMEATSMDFDNTGKYLSTLSSSGSLSVFDWKNQALIASSPTFSSNTRLKFYTDSSSIVECGIDYIRFWTLKYGCTTFEVGTNNQTDSQNFHSMSIVGKNIYIGTSSGDMIKFAEKKFCGKVKAHASAVTCMASTDEGIVTGSSDRFVKVWNSRMRCTLSVNTENVGVRHEISNVTWNKSHITIGTAGNEIWQLVSCDGSMTNNGKPITMCHSLSSGGLSIHPIGHALATSSDDSLLRFWNILEYDECKEFDLGMPSRACAYSPNGRMIAVGMGKPVKENARIIDGRWVIINVHDDSYQIIAERRDSRKYISGIKWHSNGSRIAVGSRDKICVYDVSSKPEIELSLLSMIEMKSPATHFDFSRDSKYLRVSTEGEQLEFFEAGPGLHIQDSSRLKDVYWDTDTCIFGWNVQGVWSGFDNCSEVLSLDCYDHNGSSSLACGDSAGRVKLYRHPCLSNQAHFLEYKTHFGPVSHVRWLPGGSHLVSIGRYDNSIMLWKHQIEGPLAEKESASPKLNFRDELFIPKEISTNSVPVASESSHFSMIDNPSQVAELLHLHGYQSSCLGNSSCYASGDIMYPASNLVVIYEKKTNSQLFFNQHETTISAFCISSSCKLVASADGSKPAKIRVWDYRASTEIAALPGVQGHQVSFLTFNPDGTLLASISHKDYCNYTVCVFITLTGDWTDGSLYLHCLAGHNHIYFGVFTAFDSHKNYLVTGGAYHLNFWSESQMSLIPAHQSVNEQHICGLSVEDNLITGTKGGLLVLWDDKNAIKEIKAHNGDVLALCSCPEGLISGGSDGFVSIWCKKSLQKIASFELGNSPSSSHHICSLDAFQSLGGKSTTKVLVGTRSSDIYEVSRTTGAVSKVCGNHEFGQVEDVCIDPTSHNHFATVGSDKAIYIWNLDLNKSVSQATISELALRCIDWGKDGSIIVGCDTQCHKTPPYTFMILNATDLSVIHTGKDSLHSITAVKFSPDTKIFACAAANFKIYVHENSMDSNFTLLSVSDKHNSIVTAIDFSIDTLYFQSISSAHELIHFVTESGQPSSAQEVQWATNTCMHRPPSVSASRQCLQKECEPICSMLSSDHQLLIFGMSSGSIKLTSFEDGKEQHERSFNAHCGPVAKAILNNDGKTLITIGKIDRTLKIWRINDA